MSTDDFDLIQECLAGQTEAFGQLVIRYQNRLYNTLFNVLGSAEDARDVAQDTFVLAFQKLSAFRGQSAFYSWLFRIALNSAVNQQRKHRRKSISLDAARANVGFDPTDPHPDQHPSHSLELSEKQALVRTALQQLPDDYRTVLVLKEMEGLKYDEIAEIVGCPVGTVRSRIFRARNELREKLSLLFKPEE